MTKQLNIQHIKDEQGKPIFVQIPYDEWVHFQKNVNTLIEQVPLAMSLKNAFEEVQDIKDGKKEPMYADEMLKAFAGIWSEEEASVFESAVQESRKIS